jgi:hypothetical protein
VASGRALAPEKWLNWINQLDGWDFKLEPITPHPIRLANGMDHQSFRYAGQFYVDQLNFRRYPFQTIHLPLVLELNETLPQSGPQGLRLVPDNTDSGVGGYIDIMGYKTTGFRITRQLHEYSSDFGLPNTLRRDQHYKSEQIGFEVSYQQSPNAALLTLFLPLCVIMSLVLFSPLLSASLWEIRLGIPPTALLTLIFLQQSYRDKLPDLPYATYMDLVYNACYVVNLILFSYFLWSSNRVQQAAETELAAVTDRIDAIDRYFQLGLTSFLVVITAANWIFLPGSGS